MDSIMSADEIIRQYGKIRPLYEGLGLTVKSTLASLLSSNRIVYLTVDYRTKTVESFDGKIRRKSYVNPLDEITDLAGIRIITFIESDAESASDLVRRTFNVHPADSLDKSLQLGIDRVGYRSVHYVCDLGHSRFSLPEYERYKGLRFEIQIRTVLQHAWAEIEHDRNYKFAGTLPAPLQRRLSLVAGVLEIADREFDQIASEIDNYAGNVYKKTEVGDLDVEINSTSLATYLPDLFRKEFGEAVVDAPIDAELISELHDFGLKNLADLKAMFSDSTVRLIKEQNGNQNFPSVLREAMILTDIKKYFSYAWKGHWGAIDSASVSYWKRKWPADEVDKIVADAELYFYDLDGSVEEE